MGSSVFPAPAAGISVADGNAAGWGATATGDTTWTLISTQTGNSSTNIMDFTSLSGYKKYRLVGAVITNSTNQPGIVKVNNDTNAIYNWHGVQTSSSTNSNLNGRAFTTFEPFGYFSANNGSFQLTIEQANLSGVKPVFGSSTFYDGAEYSRTFTGEIRLLSAITSIRFYTGAGVISGGSVSLYGGN